MKTDARVYILGIPESRFLILWKWVVFLNAAICIDIWAKSQGWKIAVSHLAFGDIGTYSIAVYGIILTVPLIVIISLLLRSYARAVRYRRVSESWTGRVPNLWRLDAQAGSFGAKLDKAIVLLLAIGISAGALVHFINKIFAATVYINGKPFASGIAAHLMRYVPLGEAIQLGSVYDARFQDWSGGITYYPFWESWFLFISMLASLVFLAASLSTVFVTRSRTTSGAAV